jgi:predicted aspartyl protease
MGIFRVRIEVGDPHGTRYEAVDALVETEASHTTFPRPLLERMGIKPHARGIFELADGRQVELAIGRTWVRIDGREEITLVVFGDEGSEPLLGAVTLEEYQLGIDAVRRRLLPVPGLLK